MNPKKSVKISLAIIMAMFISSMADASFLDDEAGISAYSVVSSVDIAVAATAYKNIEYQTSEYIVGSVAIPNYNEIDDVHVYLHSSGEIIAYYLRDINLCHMIDWIAYHSFKQITGSKLQTALEIVASAMGETLTGVTYYDFRYPDAPKIKIIVDNNSGTGTDTFRFLIPGTYTIHAAFWSHAAYDPGSTASSTFKLDDISIDSLATSDDAWNEHHGDLSSAQLPPDVFHEVSISGSTYDFAYGAIVLLYTEP